MRKRSPKDGGDGRALRIHQALAKKLATKILSGRLKPGDSLGGEVEQSEALGLSRTAYREAMRILIAKGLVESKPKTGTHVTPRARWNLLDPEILAWIFSGQPDQRFARDLFELRRIIEPAAAALAAERRTEAHLKRMREGVAGMQRFGLATEEGREADQLFHHAILEATGNEALTSLSSSVGAAVTWTTYFKQRNQKNPRDALPDHERVLAAIEGGNAKRAHAAMCELVDAALSDMGIRSVRRRPRRG
jgi:DNA-binding FadR family transcriptional regulator